MTAARCVAAAECSKEEFKLFNIFRQIERPEKQDKTKTQNLPMKENPKTNSATQGLPLVGIGSCETPGKDPRRTVPHLARFHDHLVLESNPLPFRIILRLDNAIASLIGRTSYQDLSFLKESPRSLNSPEDLPLVGVEATTNHQKGISATNPISALLQAHSSMRIC